MLVVAVLLGVGFSTMIDEAFGILLAGVDASSRTRLEGFAHLPMENGMVSRKLRERRGSISSSDRLELKKRLRDEMQQTHMNRPAGVDAHAHLRCVHT